MLTKFAYLLLACFAFILVACDGVQVTPNGMGLQVQLDSTFNGGPTDLSFDAGYIRLSEIEFEGEKTNGDEIEYEVEQLIKIDLATGLATPTLNPIMIPAGEYEELELEVQGAEDGTIVFLEGSFTDSSLNIVPLQLDIQESFSLEIEYENYSIDSTLSFGALFIVDPSYWFANINQQELQQADKDSNGVVIIAPNSNPVLYDKVTADLSDGIEWEWDD